jgi:uncharacterized protein (TIGR02117 family)
VRWLARTTLGLLAVAATLAGALAWGFVAPTRVREDAALGPVTLTAATLACAYALRRLPTRRPSRLALALAAATVPLVVLVDVALFSHLEIPAQPPASAAEYCQSLAGEPPACRRVGALAARAAPSAPPADVVPIFLVDHGMHTGLAVAAADLDLDRWPQARALAAAGYVELGWGDAEYFQADDPSVLTAIDAFVTPGPSVLHVATFAAAPPARFPHDEVLRLGVARERFPALQRYLQDAFALDADGAVVVTSPGDYGAGSNYVRANGLYYFPNTCNVWTARALAAAGLPVVPEVAISTRNLMYQTRRLALRVDGAPP